MPRYIGYYALLGLIVAAAIVASAYLPAAIAGVSLAIAGIVVWIVDRVFPASAKPHLSGLATTDAVYLAVVAAIVVVALVVVWTLVRESGTYWVAWVLGGVVLLATLAASFVVRGNQLSRTDRT